MGPIADIRFEISIYLSLLFVVWYGVLRVAVWRKWGVARARLVLALCGSLAGAAEHLSFASRVWPAVCIGLVLFGLEWVLLLICLRTHDGLLGVARVLGVKRPSS